MVKDNIQVLSEGSLEFEPGKPIPCAVLKEGDQIIRVITNTGMFKAFDRTPHGAQRIGGLPSVVGAHNVAKYISEDDRAKFEPYLMHKGNKVITGYDATTITVICDAYLEAENKEKLTVHQQKVLEKSKIILRALAKIGITALVDEATGFQYEREYNALQQLLKTYISEDLLKWQRRFPRAFYKEIYRLYDWPFDPANTKHPQYLGKFTNTYVYDLFPDEVMTEIKSRNPIQTTSNNTSYRKNKFHQYLTVDIGQPQLDQHVSKLIGVMKLSDNMDEFKKNYTRAFEDEIAIKNSKKQANSEVQETLF